MHTWYIRYALICSLFCIYRLNVVFGQCGCCCMNYASSPLGRPNSKCIECYRYLKVNMTCQCKIKGTCYCGEDECPDQCISQNPPLCNLECNPTTDTPIQDSEGKCPDQCISQNPPLCNLECNPTTDTPIQDSGTEGKCPDQCIGHNPPLCNLECNPTTDTPIQDSGTDITVTVIIVSCAVVIVVIAILITICYWIRQSNKRDMRSKKHPKVKHDVQSEGIEIEDERRVSNQPLPTVPVENHYTPQEALNNTYEQIDPGYSSLKRNAQKPEYATLGQTTEDTSKKETSDKATDTVDDVSKYENVQKNRSTENSNPNTDGKRNDTLSATVEVNSETMSKQQEDEYSKLNRNSYINSVDDENSNYDKLITTPTAGDESEECYSHLNRTSHNLERDNPDYSKLEPVKGNTNDGYEETIPNLVSPPQEKEDKQCESILDQRNNKIRLEGDMGNGGYEVAIISDIGNDITYL